MSDTTTLKARIQNLEDIEAIKKLTATYGLYVNKGWNGEVVNFDKLSDIFTDDARWKSAAMEADVTGVENIIALLETATAPGDLAMHSFTNPIIDIDGDTATANWLLWVAGTDGENGTEVFQSEDLICVRTPQGWRIKSLNLHFGALRNI
jgi:ketosteroid isomerase-like protein